jgi:tetratricopeptide (TPR) repeat protein
MTNKALIAVLLAIVLAFLVVTVLKRGDPPEDTGQKILQTDSERANIRTFWNRYHAATALRTQGSFEEAVLKYEEALALDPEHEESLYYLGNCQYEIGRFEAALATYKRLVRLNPLSQRGHSRLGSVYSSHLPGAPRDLALASEAFQRNAEINQEHSGPFLQLGRLQIQEGNHQKALEFFEMAAGFRSAEGNFMAGWTLFTQRRFGSSMDFFRRVFESDQMEQAISGKGMVSEGNLESVDKRLSQLEVSRIKAQVYAFWSAARISGYPENIPPQYRLDLKPVQQALVSEVELDLSDSSTGSWVDFDSDGQEDLVALDKSGSARFYRNVSGKLVLTQAPDELRGSGAIWELVWSDIDQDGDPDLYAVRPGWFGIGRSSLYENQGGWDSTGGGRLVDVTGRAGLEGIRATHRAVFGDLDRDGWADLVEIGSANQGTPTVRLYRNQSGHFAGFTGQSGIEAEDTVVDCVLIDYDGDGHLDLYLLRWGLPGILYRNLGRGRFSDITLEVGLSDLAGNSYSATSLDYDRDGKPDLFLSVYAPYERVLQSVVDPSVVQSVFAPRLLKNNGRRFEDVTEKVGLLWPYGTAAVTVSDANADGWQDLVLANGGLDPERFELSVILLNRGGRAFDPVYIQAMDQPRRARGVAVSDFNGDSHLDIFLGGDGLYRVSTQD